MQGEVTISRTFWALWNVRNGVKLSLNISTKQITNFHTINNTIIYFGRDERTQNVTGKPCNLAVKNIIIVEHEKC